MERVGLVLAAEDHQESIPVVLIHPPVQERVGERRAHGHDVEQRVYKFVLLEPEHQVQITGQLEHVKRQPAGRKHHHHQRQHLGGLLASVDAIAAAGRADVVLQLDPDAYVGVADDGQRNDVLQQQHRQAVDESVPAGAVRPLLRAHRDAQVDRRDLLIAVLSEDGQRSGQDGGRRPSEGHDEEAGTPRQPLAQVENDTAVTLQCDDGQGQDGHVDAQGLSKGDHVAQHVPKLPLVQQSVDQSEGQAERIDQKVSQGQVGYEEVGHRPHVPVTNNHVDHKGITQQPQQDDQGISCYQGDLDSEVLGDVRVETRRANAVVKQKRGVRFAGLPFSCAVGCVRWAHLTGRRN